MRKTVYIFLLLLYTLTGCKKEKADIIYQDDLTTYSPAWLVDATNDVSYAFNQGHYSITVYAIGQVYYTTYPYATLNFPYSVQVDGVTDLVYPGDIGSVAVYFNNVDANNHSRVDILTDGTYDVLTKTNGTYSTITPITYSNAINPGSASKNTIKVIQNQSDMQLLINNVLVGTFSIALPASVCTAGIGVASSTSNYGQVTGLFNNFILSKN